MVEQQQQSSTNNNQNQNRVPIVCPGHTRPLAELQFCQIIADENNNNADDNNTSRTFLVSACHDAKPMLRDGITGNWIGTWIGHKGAVWSCQLDGTASLAATASGDFSVRVWDAITGSHLWTFPEHKHIVKTCAFAPNSKYLATGGHEGILRIYNLQQQMEWHTNNANKNNNKKNKQSSQQQSPPKPIEIPVQAEGDKKKKGIIISKICWLNDNILLTGCGDGKIRVWDIIQNAKQQPIHILETDEASEIRDMEITNVVNPSKKQSDDTAGRPSPTTTIILTVAAGTKVYFFGLPPTDDGKNDDNNYNLIHKYDLMRNNNNTDSNNENCKIHFRDEGGASLHPYGHKFIAGGSDLWVRIFDFETGKQLDVCKGHHGPIRCLRYAPLPSPQTKKNTNATTDSLLFASGSEDGTIRLWTDYETTTNSTPTTASK